MTTPCLPASPSSRPASPFSAVSAKKGAGVEVVMNRGCCCCGGGCCDGVGGVVMVVLVLRSWKFMGGVEPWVLVVWW